MDTIDTSVDYSDFYLLIVDDVPLNLLLIQKMLSKFNFKVKTASHGQQALDLIDQEKPDVILLDLMMPGIDGFEVLRRLRAKPETSDIQIVILSALNSNDDIVKGFQLGANDFITKPIIMDKLLASVEKQLEICKEKRNK